MRASTRHIENQVLGILRSRTPTRWYATGDMSKIINAERAKRGKPPIRYGLLKRTLQRLETKSIIEARQVPDDGRVRNEWRAAPRPPTGVKPNELRAMIQRGKQLGDRWTNLVIVRDQVRTFPIFTGEPDYIRDVMQGSGAYRVLGVYELQRRSQALMDAEKV